MGAKGYRLMDPDLAASPANATGRKGRHDIERISATATAKGASQFLKYHRIPAQKFSYSFHVSLLKNHFPTWEVRVLFPVPFRPGHRFGGLFIHLFFSLLF